MPNWIDNPPSPLRVAAPDVEGLTRSDVARRDAVDSILPANERATKKAKRTKFLPKDDVAMLQNMADSKQANGKKRGRGAAAESVDSALAENMEDNETIEKKRKMIREIRNMLTVYPSLRKDHDIRVPNLDEPIEAVQEMYEDIQLRANAESSINVLRRGVILGAAATERFATDAEGFRDDVAEDIDDFDHGLRGLMLQFPILTKTGPLTELAVVFSEKLSAKKIENRARKRMKTPLPTNREMKEAKLPSELQEFADL